MADPNLIYILPKQKKKKHSGQVCVSAVSVSHRLTTRSGPWPPALACGFTSDVSFKFPFPELCTIPASSV